MNLPLSPFASWCLVAIVVGLPTLALWSVLRVASITARAEEEIVADELLRKEPAIRPTPQPRPYIRETHRLDYSTMTKADIAKAFGQEAQG